MKNSVLVAATPDLQKSLDFYRKLNFTHFEDHGTHYMVDDTVVVEITDKKSIRSGVKLYKESWLDEVALLRKLTTVADVEGGFVLMGFSGIWIQLVEGQGIVSEVDVSGKSMLGAIAGLSLEGISIPQMNQVWKILGFKKTMGEETGGWMTAMNDDGLTISMMKLNSCPHSFYNPSLTYFNGKENLKIIENIRTAGIEITEEIAVFNKDGIVDNIIIRDPGGFGFFVFSD